MKNLKKQLGSESETGERKSRGKRVGEQLDMCVYPFEIIDCVLVLRLMNMEALRKNSVRLNIKNR